VRAVHQRPGRGRGPHGGTTQYTVNNQMVNATLMNIADNPTNVQVSEGREGGEGGNGGIWEIERGGEGEREREKEREEGERRLKLDKAMVSTLMDVGDNLTKARGGLRRPITPCWSLTERDAVTMGLPDTQVDVHLVQTPDLQRNVRRERGG